jgi:hypothetical protein
MVTKLFVSVIRVFALQASAIKPLVRPAIGTV